MSALDSLDSGLIEKRLAEAKRVGAKEELVDCLTTLRAIDCELDRRLVDSMLKNLIKVKEKRLKSLEEKGVQ